MSQPADVPARASRVRAWLGPLAVWTAALAGMLLVGAWLSATSSCWLAYLLVGSFAGAIARGGGRIWLVWVAAAAVYPVAVWLGLPRPGVEPAYWVAVTLVGACLATAGYGIGALVAARLAAARRAPGEPTGRGIAPVLLVFALLVGVLGFGGWVALSAVAVSEELVDSPSTWAGCGTPASAYGWTYEAINYDPADDARLLAVNADLDACTDFGSAAGDAVVASDGVRIAGWYIPAAHGVGPEGPTIVIVPGWKSHKTEVLKYAPPFHETYNLVLVDLRHGGRSDRSYVTWGLRERLDLRAMIDWLERTKHPAWIGAMGNSMGAATVVAEAVDDGRVRALILDSMHASLATSFEDGIEFERHLPGFPTAWVGVAAASLRLGEDLTSVDPVRTIARLGDRPVLLIHGRADGLDRPEHSAELNLAAAREAGVPVELRYCDTGEHGRLIDACGPAWAAWATDFFAAARSR
jgi:hypothetical protein